MAIAIKKYVPEQSYLKALICGNPGSGKTTIGSTAPNPLFICTENGLLSIADKSPLMVEIRSVEDLRETLKYLKKEFALPKEKRELQIDTIVIDSLSEMAETIKNKLTQEGSKSMTMRDWGVLGDELMGIFRAFISLPCNVVALSHIKEDKDEDSGTIIYNPSLSGRAKEEVLRAFDIISYIFLDKKGNRTITAKESYNTKAKCRSQALTKLDTLPFDIQEWINIINTNTKFGKSEEVVKISETPDAPTPEVKAMWDAVVTSLMEDKTERNKQAIKEKAQASQKIGKEEKEWILMMIDKF